MSVAISCQGVSKNFRLHTHHKLLSQHFKALFLNDPHNQFHALTDVTFHVDEGDAVAIIGSNGAGKSTLLSVVAGLAEPDQGSVKVTGRIAALMELGSGFHPDLSGMENIFLNAAILGFNKRQTEAMVDTIIDFAGLREFIEEPLRTYSSGMNMRLAFSIAVHVDPDVLIIDEVLAVGDQDFQKKSFDRIRDRKSHV